MNWVKKGLIFEVNGQLEWMHSHAQLPVADMLQDGRARVYFASRSVENVSSIGYAEIDLADARVLDYSRAPVLSPGPIGFFDEHGVFPASIVTVGSRKYLYYIGWNRGHKAPLFYASIGLAVSDDGGLTFRRHSPAPVMARSRFDPCLVTSPHVFRENDLWRMTYVSGIKWAEVDGRLQSYYHIKYAESPDGIKWRRDGRVCIDFGSPDETNIARSAVIREGGLYRMWYCYVRGTAGYRMGYAESPDFVTWTRKDGEAGIDVSDDDFDNEMICYPNIICDVDTRYLFYNGNGFGRRGFGLAISRIGS